MFIQDVLQAIADYTGQSLELTAFFAGLAFVLVFFLPYAALALVFVVPGLVTTTGLLFIPALFGRAARRIRHERDLLG